MTDPRVFVKIAVRLIGLVLFVYSIGVTLGWMMTTLYDQHIHLQRLGATQTRIGLNIAGHLVQLAEPLIGLYLFFDGRWVINKVLQGLGLPPERAADHDTPTTPA